MADQTDPNLDDTVVVNHHSNDSVDGEATAKSEAQAKKLTSLLEVHLEKNLASHSRIVLVSKLVLDNALSPEKVAQALPSQFKTLAKDFRIPLTGIGVVQDSVFIAALECFPDDLCTLVRRVDNLGFLKSTRVIVNTEDCPTRRFSPLSFHRMKLSKEGEIDLDGEFPDAATAGFAVYEKILRVGKAMTDSKNPQIPSAHSNNLPSNSRCLAYLNHPGFASAQEFLELFDDPMHSIPLMDQIWPHQALIPLS